MRSGQNRRIRGRGRSNKAPNILTKSFESNGPDIKVRGTAQHIAEKYSQLARDANVSGDPVVAENYYQHAEHYLRLIASAQEGLRLQSAAMSQGDNSSFEDDMDEESHHPDDDEDGESDLVDLSFQPQPVVLNGNHRDQRSGSGSELRSGRPQRYERQERPERVTRPEQSDRNDNNRGVERSGERRSRFLRRERPAPLAEGEKRTPPPRRDYNRDPNLVQKTNDIVDEGMLPAFLTAPIRNPLPSEAPVEPEVEVVVLKETVQPQQPEEHDAPPVVKPRRRRVAKVAPTEASTTEKVIGE